MLRQTSTPSWVIRDPSAWPPPASLSRQVFPSAFLTSARVISVGDSRSQQPRLRYPWANCQPSGAAATADWRKDRLSCTNYMWSMSSLQEPAVARADADNESTLSQAVRCLSKKSPAFISWRFQLFLSTRSSVKCVIWFLNSLAGTLSRHFLKWDSP